MSLGSDIRSFRVAIFIRLSAHPVLPLPDPRRLCPSLSGANTRTALGEVIFKENDGEWVPTSLSIVAVQEQVSLSLSLSPSLPSSLPPSPPARILTMQEHAYVFLPYGRMFAGQLFPKCTLTLFPCPSFLHLPRFGQGKLVDAQLPLPHGIKYINLRTLPSPDQKP